MYLLPSLSRPNEDSPSLDEPYPIRQYPIQYEVDYACGESVGFGDSPGGFVVDVEQHAGDGDGDVA